MKVVESMRRRRPGDRCLREKRHDPIFLSPSVSTAVVPGGERHLLLPGIHCSLLLQWPVHASHHLYELWAHLDGGPAWGINMYSASFPVWLHHGMWTLLNCGLGLVRDL